jgi:hypothetical protein
MPKHRRIISNDDGWIISNMKKAVTPETIKELMVDTYDGSPIDAISWCVGNGEVYQFETEVGERVGAGDGFESPEEETHYWAKRNLQGLIETCGGPVTEIARQFVDVGIDFFPSMRMNSHYVIPFDSPNFSNFRRQHRDWLIGQPDEHIPAPTIEYAISRGIDYKFPGVRNHLLAVIFELIERFEVAGIELDYFRHPAFFRVEEAYSNRYLMTDFIRRIRTRLDEVGAERSRHLDLLVRVPPSLYDSARIGLDIERWIKEGLVDIVAAGGGFIPFEQPVREFVQAAEGTECQILGSLEALRWALDEEVLRALAARFWDAGVDGFYLFNYFNTPNEWKRRVLGEMVDRDRLPRLSKRYELDHSDRIESKESHLGAFRYAVPRVQLPILLEETLAQGGPVLQMDVAEDVGAASSVQLGLGFDCLADDDELEVRVNGEPLAWGSRRVSKDGWSYCVFDAVVYHTTMTTEIVEGVLVELDVPVGGLLKGGNEVMVRLIRGQAGPPQGIVLKEVRLSIAYD